MTRPHSGGGVSQPARSSLAFFGEESNGGRERGREREGEKGEREREREGSLG